MRPINCYFGVTKVKMSVLEIKREILPSQKIVQAAISRNDWKYNYFINSIFLVEWKGWVPSAEPAYRV